MSAMAPQITSLTIFHSIVYSRRRSKKTSKLRVIGLCEGNSPVTGEFPAQRASNAEIVSIWWRHHDNCEYIMYTYIFYIHMLFMEDVGKYQKGMRYDFGSMIIQTIHSLKSKYIIKYKIYIFLKAIPNTKLKCFSSRLAVVFAQSTKAMC